MTRSFDIGGGELKWKPEILENAYKCRRYVIDVTGLDPRQARNHSNSETYKKY